MSRASVVLAALVILACAALTWPLRHLPATAAVAEWRVHGGDAGHTQYVAARSDHARERRRAEGGVDLSHGRRGRERALADPVQPDRRPRRALRDLAAAQGVRARRGDRQRRWVFDPFDGGRRRQLARRQPRRRLLGGRRRTGASWSRLGQRLYALDAKTGSRSRLRRQGQRQPARRPGPRRVGALRALEHARRDLQGPADPGHARVGRAGPVRAGRHPRLRRAHRQDPLDLPHHPAAGRVRLRHVADGRATQRVGGANAWSGIAVDHERGLVFLPTGSAAFDFWGGNRLGENLFANCLLALDAATGERVWHYQLVHHDLWDRDLPAAPILVTVTRDGRPVDAVAQATKSGHVFVFDRETGKPLFPIEERPVPPTDLEDEQAWPTQPLPVKPPPFARQRLTEADAHRRARRRRTEAALKASARCDPTGSSCRRARRERSSSRASTAAPSGAAGVRSETTGLPLRQRQRDGVDPDDGALEVERGRRGAAVPDQLRRLPRRGAQGRLRADGAVTRAGSTGSSRGRRRPRSCARGRA